MAEIKSLAFTRRITNKEKEYDEHDEKIIDTVKRLIKSQDINGIIVSADASHYGIVNENKRLYTIESGKKAYSTFYKPTAKPILRMHDMYSEPRGRVMDAQVVSGNYRSNGQVADGVLKTGLMITDKDAIEKIKDGRYSTLSVGFSSASMKCSICGFDWKQYFENPDVYAEKFGGICEHIPGRVYDKKVAYDVVDIARYNELSIVEGPAHDSAVMKAYTENVMKDFAGTSLERDILRKDYISRHMIDMTSSETSGLNYVIDDSVYKSKTYNGVSISNEEVRSTDEKDDITNNNPNNESGATPMDKELEEYLKGLNEKVDALSRTISTLTKSPEPSQESKDSDKEEKTADASTGGKEALEEFRQTVKAELDAIANKIIEAIGNHQKKETPEEDKSEPEKQADKAENDTDTAIELRQEMDKLHDVLSKIENRIESLSADSREDKGTGVDNISTSLYQPKSLTM